MHHYIGVLEHENGTWGVWIPDLPGCVSAAFSSEKAVSNAVEAVRDVAEDMVLCGEPLPVARSHEDVAKDPDVAEALRKGDALVVLPVLINGERPVRTNVSIDLNMLQAIDAAAKLRGMTRSAFLVAAARQKILSES